MTELDTEAWVEHNPRIGDVLPALGDAGRIEYRRIHRVLADGNFVLAVCEGRLDGVHSAFYDLFRVADAKIVEHWDTVEAVPPRAEWKNDNGKF